MGLMEPLHYRLPDGTVRKDVPACAVDADGNYCWAQARLPGRMGKKALHSALRQHFAFPGADFLLLSRKLAGVYAFIAGLDARFDACSLVDKIVQER